MKKKLLTLLLAATLAIAPLTSAYAASTISLEPGVLSPVARGNGNTAKTVKIPKGVVPRTDVPDATKPVIEVDNENARLLVRYKASDGKAYKVKISFGGVDEYYVLYAINADEYFPLPKGNGKYTVSVLRMITTTRAQVIKTEAVTLNAKDKNAAFLSSNYYVAWEYANDTLAYTKNLSKKAKGGSSVNAIYNDLMKTMVYDEASYNKLPADYVPDMDSVLRKRLGVCFDMSVLLAGMLRSSDVPTRLCFGYTRELGNQYHAWNEIFIDGKWVVVDLTYDSAYYQAGREASMAKKPGDFKATSVY